MINPYFLCFLFIGVTVAGAADYTMKARAAEAYSLAQYVESFRSTATEDAAEVVDKPGPEVQNIFTQPRTIPEPSEMAAVHVQQLVLSDEQTEDDAEAIKARMQQKLEESLGTAKPDETASATAADYVYSTPLPKEKIEELNGLTGAQKAMAQMGLRASTQKFAQKNNLPADSCEFSYTAYRVECALTAEQAAARKAGASLSAAAAKQVDKPKRLKLSGGSSCLDGSKGSLCKK